MKALAVLAAAILFFANGTAWGQETDGYQLNPRLVGEGDITAEIGVLFAPNPGAINYVNRINQFKFRYFRSDNSALRFGLNVAYDNDRDNILGQTPEQEGTMTARVFDFGITLGYEHHPGLYTKISPYYGFEILFQNRSASQDFENTDGVRYIEGYQMEVKGATLNGVGEMTARSGISYGARFILGCDMYFLERAFFGFEAGLGVIRVGEREADVTQGGTSRKIASKSRNFSIGDSAMGGVRLGCAF